MTELVTSNELLQRMQAASKRTLSTEELAKQKVSFVIGSIDEGSVTRAQVQQVLKVACG